MSGIRLIFFLGAGPAAAGRMDTAHLFGERLSAMGLDLSWYHKSAARGGPVSRAMYHGSPARVCGRSALPGVAGRVMTKLHELFAVGHFFFAALLGPFHIVQVRDDFFAGALGLAAARLRRRRFVFWLSYPFPEARLQDAREGRAHSKVYSLIAGHLSAFMLYRVILPNADHAFVQSEQMRRDLLRPGIAPEKLTAVPMGIPDADLPEVDPPGDEPLVLYLGTLARVRRLDMIVRAFALVSAQRPDARLAIVGDGDTPEDRARLVDEVRRLALERVVVFTGQLPRAQALDWVKRAAVCVSPFYPTFVLRSTSPTKLIEYMALGKAVVANDHPEQAEVLAASGAGICTAWDEREFADAILAFLADPARTRLAGKKGRQWVVGHRAYSRIAREVLSHYQTLMLPESEAPA